MRGLLAAALLVALLACAHAGDDVIAVSGPKQLDELIAKHPFLVAEVRRVQQARALAGCAGASPAGVASGPLNCSAAGVRYGGEWRQ